MRSDQLRPKSGQEVLGLGPERPKPGQEKTDSIERDWAQASTVGPEFTLTFAGFGSRVAELRSPASDRTHTGNLSKMLWRSRCCEGS